MFLRKLRVSAHVCAQVWRQCTCLCASLASVCTCLCARTKIGVSAHVCAQDRRTDGQREGGRDGRMDGLTDGRTEGRRERRTDGQTVHMFVHKYLKFCVSAHNVFPQVLHQCACLCASFESVHMFVHMFGVSVHVCCPCQFVLSDSPACLRNSQPQLF